MIHPQPITLERDGVRLEPLSGEHLAGLLAAAADGELWNLWFTAVPAPDATPKYIEDALKGQQQGHMLPWAVRELASGDAATCALLVNGTVTCWGSGEHGELGHGNTETIGDDETPASAGSVNVGGPVISIAAGFRHVCASLQSGGVRCWGRAS